MSKCFGDLMELFKGETEDVGTKEYDLGDDRFFEKFESPEQYVKSKIEMLEVDMCIKLADEEIAHLRELKTETAIDAAVRSIIARHWV